MNFLAEHEDTRQTVGFVGGYITLDNGRWVAYC